MLLPQQCRRPHQHIPCHYERNDGIPKTLSKSPNENMEKDHCPFSRIHINKPLKVTNKTFTTLTCCYKLSKNTTIKQDTQSQPVSHADELPWHTHRKHTLFHQGRYRQQKTQNKHLYLRHINVPPAHTHTHGHFIHTPLPYKTEKQCLRDTQHTIQNTMQTLTSRSQ